ncbi:ras-related protein Rab-8B-like [Amphiura filiformis]|uniref:ras-related protein Rab-8B-like n=1 Tax=Amphiura filiformis TaxID=82378 RepID=UPI003B20C16E
MVWDTAGQERFRTLTTAYYRGAMGILLLYDVTNETTFSHITSWLENISHHAPPDVAKILVGNKCDMDGVRAVPTMRAVNMASAFDLPFYETSAKVAVNVEPAFMALVKKMLDRYRHRLARFKSVDGGFPNNNIELQQKQKEKRQWCSC